MYATALSEGHRNILSIYDCMGTVESWPEPLANPGLAMGAQVKAPFKG